MELAFCSDVDSNVLTVPASHGSLDFVQVERLLFLYATLFMLNDESVVTLGASVSSDPSLDTVPVMSIDNVGEKPGEGSRCGCCSM